MSRYPMLLLFLLFVSLSSSLANAETAKPENPRNLNLELLVVAYRAEGTNSERDAKLIAKVEEVVKKHESEPLSTLQDAVQETLPQSNEKVATKVDAFSLKTFHDLEQWMKFGNSRALPSADNGPARWLVGETEVKATPWIFDEERFGIGVTVLRQIPTSWELPRTKSPQGLTMENLSFTTNTLVAANEASVINSYRHHDEKLSLVMIVIARVSR
ncbi:hypothetical protein [Blastopirellula marina]|uniref:Uncharacterized protein n=1 Tax=Blastopirellula marina TaxID=124 RepID=A0A2S8G190_9BACT|nr:hypothetical protein [Blastopirellula marina]PQO38208.1 hypothetical protein C5Y98_09055 [Blastopirellula marina]PTL44864.1 hypothetical protein C5Y97_09060 [Blastopirellula marina]